MASMTVNGGSEPQPQKYRTHLRATWRKPSYRLITCYPERATSQPENPYSKLIPEQKIAIIPEFELESGVVIYNVPLAYKTYGSLSPDCDNAMVICHALTGSADVGDWWGPLLGGPGKAFDMSRFFVVCMNSLGSPYGSASPVTSKNGDPQQEHYGPEFPLTTIRDDVKYGLDRYYKGDACMS